VIFCIWIFAKIYKINTQESEKSWMEYLSVGDFFIRQLKAGARPLGDFPLVHPADSKISQLGIISDGQLIQAKGLKYSVQEICQDLEAYKKYEQGLFVTYYLCPTDYHRVHAPVNMVVDKVTYAPGELWPVNQWSTHNVRNLFGINERVIIDAHSEFGPLTLVLVGATNVGQMSLSFDSNIITNVEPIATTSVRRTYDPINNPETKLSKGDHVGTFHMGSTVVMIYSKEFCEKVWPINKLKMGPYQTEWVQKFFNQSVKMGQSFLTH
jgi:phosphatidylserine decarboxylase